MQHQYRRRPDELDGCRHRRLQQRRQERHSLARQYGNTAIWFMNGLQIKSAAGLGNVPVAWTIQSANAE
jgi:hypothetical protein